MHAACAAAGKWMKLNSQSEVPYGWRTVGTVQGQLARFDDCAEKIAA